MKKQIVSILAILALVPASLAFACTEDGLHGIFPDNNMKIPASSFGAYNVSETQFNASIARMTKLYTPIFATENREYKVIADWNDATVNAFADRAGNVSQVHMFGGLARHPKITPDAFELVICHETGHHMGGAPRKKSLFSTSWAANEGEADYYATITCGRLLWANDDNETIVSKMEIPAVVTEQCQKSFDKANDIAICKREAMGGKSLADTLADLGKTPVTDFSTPNTSVVKKTFDEHPEAQCRLDTYFQGALCAKTTPAILSDTDPTAFVCSEEKGDALGTRPLCWYKPMEKGAPTGGSSWPSSKLSSR